MSEWNDSSVDTVTQLRRKLEASGARKIRIGVESHSDGEGTVALTSWVVVWRWEGSDYGFDMHQYSPEDVRNLLVQVDFAIEKHRTEMEAKTTGFHIGVDEAIASLQDIVRKAGRVPEAWEDKVRAHIAERQGSIVKRLGKEKVSKWRD